MYACADVQMSPDADSLPADELERLAHAFRLLGDPGRLRLVAALLGDRELSVRALSGAASLSETATSQQLRLLYEAGVVRRRRVGRQVIYRLGGSDARAFARGAVQRAALRMSQRKDSIVTYVITEPCIDVKDKSCVDVCPVDCIHESEHMLVIDPEECIDCGACEPECPVEAIYPEDAVPDKWEPFIRINYAYAEGMNSVNGLVQEQIAQSPPPPIAGYRD
jgi:NAD-dependent dihydropyrimidine dehydrogenase PreA subunit/DNA-binding transcriptional ArsR family regulator